MNDSLDFKLQMYCKKVADSLPKGLTENIYHEALCVLLRQENISYSKEQILPIEFENVSIGNVRADIITENIVIECKALNDELREIHYPQIIVYMNLLNKKKGIFVNFNQNPCKDTFNYITVIRHAETYIFRNVVTQEEIELDVKGNKIIKDTTQEDYSFIQKCIVEKTDSLLIKSECKEFFIKHFNTKDKQRLDFVFQTIESLTKSAFKDKQINGKKYSNCIFGYELLTN